MPLSLFNNLSLSIQETEHLLNLRRSDYTHLKTRYDVHLAITPQRSTRLNQLARTSTDLLRQKAASRRKIEEEKLKLKSYEDARAAVAAELENLRAEDRERTDLRQKLLELQDEIVSIDDELQTFRMCARKIERRARLGRDVRTQTQRRQAVLTRRSPSPVAVEVVVLSPPRVLPPKRQAGVEVRIPLKPPRVATASTSVPSGGRAIHATSEATLSCIEETSEKEAPSDGRDGVVGSKQLRSARACVVRASIELPL